MPQSGEHLNSLIINCDSKLVEYLASDFADLVGVVLRLVDGAYFEHALVLDELLRVLRVILDKRLCQK